MLLILFHPNCRCERVFMQVIKAGEAIKLGTNGADWWLKYLGELPKYYILKDDAEELGWDRLKGNLADVLPGHMVYDVYQNWDNVLPQKEGRIWYEADLNYTEGYRNKQRLVFSNDGLIFVTYDHYETFIEVD